MAHSVSLWLEQHNQHCTPWGAMHCSQMLVQQAVAGVLVTRAALGSSPAWRAALDFLATHPVLVHAANETSLHSSSRAIWMSERMLAQAVEGQLTGPQAACWPEHGHRVAWAGEGPGQDPAESRLTLPYLGALLLAQAYRQVQLRSAKLPALREKQGGRCYVSPLLTQTSSGWTLGQETSWRKQNMLPPPPVMSSLQRQVFARASLVWLRSHSRIAMEWSAEPDLHDEVCRSSPWHLAQAFHPGYTNAWNKAVRQAMQEQVSGRNWMVLNAVATLGIWAPPWAAETCQHWHTALAYHDVQRHHVRTTPAVELYRQPGRRYVDDLMKRLGLPPTLPKGVPDVRHEWADMLWWSLVWKHTHPEVLHAKWWLQWFRPDREGARAPAAAIFGSNDAPSWAQGQTYALQHHAWSPDDLRVHWSGLASEEAGMLVLERGVRADQRLSSRTPSLVMVAMQQGWSAPAFDHLMAKLPPRPSQAWSLQGISQVINGRARQIFRSRGLLEQVTRAQHVRVLMTRFPETHRQASRVLGATAFGDEVHLSGVYREVLRHAPGALVDTPHWLVHRLQRTTAQPKLDGLSRRTLFALVRWLQASAGSPAQENFPWREWWRAPLMNSDEVWAGPRFCHLMRAALVGACGGRPDGPIWSTLLATAAATRPGHPAIPVMHSWRVAWETQALEGYLEASGNSVSRKRI